jgi:hypothetical protein
MWMSREFFLLSGIFPTKKSKTTSKKFHKKIAPSAFSICYWLSQSGSSDVTTSASRQLETMQAAMRVIPPCCH